MSNEMKNPFISELMRRLEEIDSSACVTYRKLDESGDWVEVLCFLEHPNPHESIPFYEFCVSLNQTRGERGVNLVMQVLPKAKRRLERAKRCPHVYNIHRLKEV